MAEGCNGEVKEIQFSWAMVLLTFEKLYMFFTEKCILSFRKSEEQSFQAQHLWCHYRMALLYFVSVVPGPTVEQEMKHPCHSYRTHQKHRKPL